MKRLLLGALLAAGVDYAHAADPGDPVAPPSVVRVQIEFIELEHLDYTRLVMGSGGSVDPTAWRVKLADMVRRDRAEVVETMMMMTKSDVMATSESTREFIYPTEYAPPSLPCNSSAQFQPEDVLRNRLGIPATPTAFETRNLGSILEVAPILRDDGKTIDLNFAPEIVLPAGFAVHREFTAIGGGQHQQKMPVFVTKRVNSAVTCRDGQYLLVTVLTPSDEQGNLDPSHKLMVFVKCDVLLVK